MEKKKEKEEERMQQEIMECTFQPQKLNSYVGSQVRYDSD